jgi:hypothetical protein
MKHLNKLLLATAISTMLAGCPTTPPQSPPVNYPPPRPSGPPTPAPAPAPTPAPPAVPAPPPGPSAAEIAANESALATGVASFERGNFRGAISQLTPLAANESALDSAQRLRALKFLAFAHCSSPGAAAKVACRETFERAFRLNAGFELAPAERGHPDWQTTFDQARRSVLGR